MSIACERCHQQNCTYTPPENYCPLKGIDHNGFSYLQRKGALTIDENLSTYAAWDALPKEPIEKAAEIYQNCYTIFNNHVFYIGSNGQLKGFSYLNLIGRIYVMLLNYFDGGETERKAIEKIEETFSYILEIGGTVRAGSKRRLSSTTLRSGSGGKFYFPYTRIAKKILAEYPKQENLNKLATRITHERSMSLKWPNTFLSSPNTQDFAQGTAWKSTTIWSHT